VAQRDVVTVLSGGAIGGLSSSAMGGGFWQGFVAGAAIAGISLAANAIAGEIKQAQLWKAAKGALAQIEDEMLQAPQKQSGAKQYSYGVVPTGLGAAGSTVDVASPYDPEINQREYLEYVAGRALSDKDFATALSMWKEAAGIENSVWAEAEAHPELYKFTSHFGFGFSCVQSAQNLNEYIQRLRSTYWKPGLWFKSGWGFEGLPHMYVMLQPQPTGILPPILVDTYIGFTFGFSAAPLWTASPNPNPSGGL